MLPSCITIVITHVSGKIKCKYVGITYPNPGPYRNPQDLDLERLFWQLKLVKITVLPLNFAWKLHVTNVRTYLETPLSLIWPLA